jgi:hypothetical protein
MATQRIPHKPPAPTLRRTITHRPDNPFTSMPQGKIEALIWSFARYNQDLIIDNRGDLNDVYELLANPGKYKKKFNLSEEQLTEIKKWLEATKETLSEQERALGDLKKTQPNNPLFDNGFENVPANYVSVYHHTKAQALSGLAERGLIPYGGKEPDLETRAIDQVFDEFTPPGFSRSNAVYAYDNLGTVPGMGKGTVVLELKVDPDKALVADADLFSEARGRYQRNDSIKDWAEEYWATANRLKRFTLLSMWQRLDRFNIPEVVIIGNVSPKFIRVKSA